MKIKNQLSIAALIMVGVFATGCSQQSVGGSQVSGGSQSQIEGGSQVAGGSQQQAEEKVVAPVGEPAVAPKPRMAGNCHTHPANSMTRTVRHCHPNPTGKHRYGGARRAPMHHGNRWTHTHPAIPRCTNSIRHTHKYNSSNHSHKYSCRGMRTATPTEPTVDVYALQRKLKAKGYYKGPVDGVVGPATRSALKRFMNR